MRCFCIIRYTQTLSGGPVYAWSVQRDVTRRVRVLPVGPHILGREAFFSPSRPSLRCSAPLRPLVWTYVSLKRVVLRRRREFRFSTYPSSVLILLPWPGLFFVVSLLHLLFFHLDNLSIYKSSRKFYNDVLYNMPQNQNALLIYSMTHSEFFLMKVKSKRWIIMNVCAFQEVIFFIWFKRTGGEETIIF